MTENDNGWVWSALEGLVDLTAQHDAAVTEAERLSGLVRDEMERIHNATGLSSERLGEMLEGMRVIGPLPGGGAPAPSAPDAEGQETSTSPDPDDPLNIPEYLRRGEGSSQEDNAPGATQAHEVA